MTAHENALKGHVIKRKVHELRKHRGEQSAEKELHSYRKGREFSKASGTWGRKNTPGY